MHSFENPTVENVWNEATVTELVADIHLRYSFNDVEDPTVEAGNTATAESVKADLDRLQSAYEFCETMGANDESGFWLRELSLVQSCIDHLKKEDLQMTEAV